MADSSSGPATKNIIKCFENRFILIVFLSDRGAGV